MCFGSLLISCELEKRTGLLRCYVSRVEIGRTVPIVDTLEKMARALEFPMYRLFTDDDRVKKPNRPAESVPNQPANSKQKRPIWAFAIAFHAWKRRTAGF
jgi:transcriptional regulator with XRE-family HTH domain